MSLFKIHARDIYQGQMPLEVLSRICGGDVIYYTHFNLKKNWPSHPTCNSQRSEYNSYRAGWRRITIMSTTEKDNDTKLNRQDFFVEIDDTIVKQFLNKVLRCQKETLLGRLRKCMLHVCFDGRCYIQELIITQYLLWS